MKPANVSTKDWWLYNILFVIEHFIGLKLVDFIFKKTKENITNKTLQSDNISQRGVTLPIEDIEYKSIEDFKKRNPQSYKTLAVFRGVAKDWGALQKWNKHFFETYYGETQVALIDNEGMVDPDTKNEFEVTNFKKFFEDIKKDKSKYLRFSRILDHNPHLLKDLDTEWLSQLKDGQNKGAATYLFIGEDGTKTPTHSALAHTAFIQVEGEKKWTIFEQNERMFLDVRSERFTYFRSNANPYKPNDPNLPLFKYAKKHIVTLRPGDILWMPSFYWHYVENITPSIGVAYKFTNLKEAFKISKTLTSMFLLHTKPNNMLTFFILNRLKKVDYQFTKSSKL